MAEDVILEQVERDINVNIEEIESQVSPNNIPVSISNEETPVSDVEVGETEIIGMTGDNVSTSLNVEARHSQYLPNQHTVGAITGLTETLADIQELKNTLYAKNINTANYYLWNDENPLQENRKGIFVCLNTNNTISACTETSEIFGVTVSAAAFAGGQAEIARNYRYALVACNGQVDVQCELNVVANNYVISNAYGIAKNNALDYGYKVIAVTNIDGIKYATISLSSWERQIADLGDNVDSLTTRMNTAESNIAGAVHVANSAINQAGDIGTINAEMNERVNQMEDTVGDMSESVEQMEIDVANAVASALQARDIATSMHTSATTLANEAFAAASNVQTYAKSLVAKIDKYSVGEYSQANGLTSAQAASIMKNGMIYVPTVNHDEELPAHRSFTVGNSYLWTIDGWQEYDSSVYISNTYPGPASTITLWYVNTDEAVINDGITYEPYTLYEWQDGWVGVASQTGNAVARSVNLLTQTTNELSGVITDARGGAVSLKAKLDDMGAQSAAVASLAIKTDGTVSGILTSAVTPVDAVNGNYYAVGITPPYAVYQYNGSTLVQVPNTSSDGVYIHKVNVASIINSVNADGDSSINLNADKINFTGFTTFLRPSDVGESGTTTIDGGRINASTLYVNAANITGTLTLGQLPNTVVKSVVVEYALSTSPSTFSAVTGTAGIWSTTAPAQVDDAYMWQQTTIIKADDTSTITQTCVQGANGVIGVDGRGIDNITIQYNITTSTDNAPIDGWTDIRPTILDSSQYVWTRNKIEWSDTDITYTAGSYDAATTGAIKAGISVAAWCAQDDITQINGGRIATGSITTSQLAADAIKSNNYVVNTTGTKLNLNNGSFDTKYFKIDANGNVTANNMTANNMILTGGTIQSSNYVVNSAGTKIQLSDGSFDSANFKIDTNGNVTAKNLTLTGSATVQGNLTVDGSVGGTLALRNTTIVYNNSGAFWGGGYTVIGANGILSATNAVIENLTATGSLNVSEGGAKMVQLTAASVGGIYCSGGAGAMMNGDGYLSLGDGLFRVSCDLGVARLTLNGTTYTSINDGVAKFG